MDHELLAERARHLSATMPAQTSVAAPGGNGTINVTGRLG